MEPVRAPFLRFFSFQPQNFLISQLFIQILKIPLWKLILSLKIEFVK